MKSVKVLSTKKLSPQQLNLLNEVQFQVEMYNAISIEKVPFELPGQIENAIVTSQNTAQIIIAANTQIKNVFCVGEKTSNLMRSQNYKVVKMAENASILAEFIVNHYKNDSFLFLCGNMRRDKLPQKLIENNINLIEKVVYNTVLKPRKFTECFDAVLFFSPSGVDSFVQENSLQNSVVFCIGNTTANEAKKQTTKVVVASQSTIENTITTAIHYFKS